MKIHEKMYSTSLACSRRVRFWYFPWLKKKKLHEIISPGHENMRKVLDTGENENCKKLHLSWFSWGVICFIGKWILKSVHLNYSRIKSVALLIWYFLYTSNFLPTPLLDTRKFYKPMGWRLQMTSVKTINRNCVFVYLHFM